MSIYMSYMYKYIYIYVDNFERWFCLLFMVGLRFLLSCFFMSSVIITGLFHQNYLEIQQLKLKQHLYKIANKQVPNNFNIL